MEPLKIIPHVKNKPKLSHHRKNLYMNNYSVYENSYKTGHQTITSTENSMIKISVSGNHRSDKFNEFDENVQHNGRGRSTMLVGKIEGSAARHQRGKTNLEISKKLGNLRGDISL